MLTRNEIIDLFVEILKKEFDESGTSFMCVVCNYDLLYTLQEEHDYTEEEAIKETSFIKQAIKDYMTKFGLNVAAWTSNDIVSRIHFLNSLKLPEMYFEGTILDLESMEITDTHGYATFVLENPKCEVLPLSLDDLDSVYREVVFKKRFNGKLISLYIKAEYLKFKRL